MSLLLESTVKVSLIVLCALGVTAVLRNRSAALRHWTLSAAIACAAVAPLLQPIAPSWSLPVNTPAAIQSLTQPGAAGGSLPQPAAVEGTPAGAPASSLNAGRLIWSVWMVGAGVSLMVLLAGLARLTWIAARAERVAVGTWADLTKSLASAAGLRRPVQLLQSDHPTLLVTWGLARPKVLLPASAREWSEERIRVVLLHELAHIQRGDWATQMAAECLRAAYWFNPLIWIASRRLRQESEHACDDAVLGGGIGAPEYATHLLDLARGVRHDRSSLFSGFPAPAMARPSSLERRFSVMLNGSTNRSPLTRPARLATTVAIVAITVLVAGLGAAQTFATFSGSVFDPSNRVLPGVKLVLTNSQSHAKHEVQTDRTGRFEFVGLPPGDYTWETTLAGFASLKGTVTVTGRDVQRDLGLQVGSLQETITITASASAAPTNPGRRVVRGQSSSPRDLPVCTGAPGAVGGNIKAPRKLVDVRPQYPENARIAGTGGVVVLDARIGTDGTVREVQVVDAPDPDLGVEAVEAVRQWEFSETLLNCQPIEVRMKVTANFVIQP